MHFFKFLAGRSELVILAVFAFVAVGLVKGCTALIADQVTAPLPYTEEARKTDPSGRIDAVIVRRHAHSTVSDPYELFLLPAGGGKCE